MPEKGCVRLHGRTAQGKPQEPSMHALRMGKMDTNHVAKS